MTDYLHKFLKWISYNRGKVLAIILVIVMMFSAMNCVKTMSLLDPTKQVSADQFHREYFLVVAKLSQQFLILEEKAENLAERYEMGAADLDAKTERLRSILQVGKGVLHTALQGNPVAWADFFPTAGTVLLGGMLAGSIYDQRKKDKTITNLKQQKKKTS